MEEIRAILISCENTINDLAASPPPFKPSGPEDALALGLVKWFKSDFMKWVDPIKCAFCQSDTKCVRIEEPTTEERKDGAGRVEIHACVNCDSVRRFPRYRNIATLLRTREGRCGE